MDVICVSFKDRLELTLKITTSFEELQEIFMDFLNKFAPIKCKYLTLTLTLTILNL